MIPKKRFREGTLFGADDRAGADVVPREPAIIHFQHEDDVVIGGNDSFVVVLFEMMNFLDDAIRTDVGGGE